MKFRLFLAFLGQERGHLEKRSIIKKFMNRRFSAIVLYPSKGQYISKARSKNFFNQLGIFSICLQSIYMTQHFPLIFFQVCWSRQFGDVFFQKKNFYKNNRNIHQTFSKDVAFMFFCSFFRHKIKISLILRISQFESLKKILRKRKVIEIKNALSEFNKN